MKKNSLIYSSAIYQLTLQPKNWRQFLLNSVRLNHVKLVLRMLLKVSLTLPHTKVHKKPLKLSVWKRSSMEKLYWYSNTSTKKKVKSKDHPTKSPKTWVTSINQTFSLSMFQNQQLLTNSKIPLANAEPFYPLNLKITSSMFKMRKSATIKKDTFYTRMSSKPRKVSRCTTKPTFLASEDQLK